MIAGAATPPTSPTPMVANRTLGIMRVIWPAFLVAGVAEAVFFTLFDPIELHFFGAPLEWPREATYTVGFFGFWALGIASSALTVLLERSAEEINRCPLPVAERPDGCPNRGDDCLVDGCGPGGEPPGQGR